MKREEVIPKRRQVIQTAPCHISENINLDQGFSKGVPRHTSVPRKFWTVPQEKVLGKCEHIKKGLCIKYLSSVTY